MVGDAGRLGGRYGMAIPKERTGPMSRMTYEWHRQRTTRMWSPVSSQTQEQLIVFGFGESVEIWFRFEAEVLTLKSWRMQGVT